MAEASRWIAIVDDDPSVLKALRRSLRVRDFPVRTFASAREFIAALSEGLPECLILDLQMPDMTGLEVLAYLKRREMQVPTIIITAHGDAGTRERCESAGAIAFLSKPLRNASLFSAIDSARRMARNRDHRRS
jgi:FixJ family two-component response regulator